MNPLTHAYIAGRPGTRGDAAREVRGKREARADKRRGRVWNNVLEWACAEWPQVMEEGRQHDDARYRTDWPYTRGSFDQRRPHGPGKHRLVHVGGVRIRRAGGPGDRWAVRRPGARPLIGSRPPGRTRFPGEGGRALRPSPGKSSPQPSPGRSGRHRGPRHLGGAEHP